ncbi:hypothetical protein [Nitrosomonas sp.]
MAQTRAKLPSEILSKLITVMVRNIFTNALNILPFILILSKGLIRDSLGL